MVIDKSSRDFILSKTKLHCEEDGPKGGVDFIQMLGSRGRKETTHKTNADTVAKRNQL